ncbi:MAG: cobalamin-dependent protein, partial [Bdellovibrionales bacterium]
MSERTYYKPKNPVRIVTAASLFDGHDASINIMRRILQDMGAEVIHLGHNRSVADVVKAVLQEGAQGVAISSYQGGHVEYFKYMKDLLNAHGAPYVKIFGGGGGVIVHEEKKLLEDYGITQIFHPEDGRKLGLEGMIEMIIKESDFDISEAAKTSKAPKEEIYNLGALPHRDLGLLINDRELEKETVKTWSEEVLDKNPLTKKESPLVLGLTGTGGAGKSSLIDELLQRFLNSYTDKKVAVVCVDPSKRKTGGSL